MTTKAHPRALAVLGYAALTVALGLTIAISETLWIATAFMAGVIVGIAGTIYTIARQE